MGFLHQLDAYEPICQATYSMAQQQQQSTTDRATVRRKRSQTEEGEADQEGCARPAPGIDQEAQKLLPTWGTNLR
ncbi:hypothetical protein PCANC_28626 [Puccinia coronata f. sp. avenae]|nr:hypothetical protein PCANC_28626 [Puccinia coronata f. sp. avenae]